MKNFDWTKFTRKIAVKSDLKTIYNAWTKREEIENWFLSKSIFYNDKNEQLSSSKNIQTNGTYDWSWHLYDIVENGKYTKTNGVDFIQFTFAGNCLVDIKLSEKAGHVIVELTQHNIPTDDDSKEGIRLGCDSGWSFFMVNLKSYYENGIDLRNKNIEFKGINN